MSRQLSTLCIVVCALLTLVGGTDIAHGAGAFYDELLDNAAQTGYWSSLAVDSKGEPHIAYYDKSARKLYYTYRSGGVWYTESVIRDGGRYCSLVLDSSDAPHVVFYYQPLVGTAGVRYGSRNKFGWNFSDVDNALNRGTWCDLVLDSSNVAHISYHDSKSKDLWYAKPGRSGWDKTLVDSVGFSGMMSAITLDTSGNPQIAHHDGSAGSLRRAWFDGSSWSTELVRSGPDVGMHPDIRVDFQGRVYLSYYTDIAGMGGALGYSKRLGFWTHETVDSGGVDGAGTSLILDGFRNPHIAYTLSGASGEVKYAHHTGTSWIVTEASSSFAGANHPSIHRTNEGAVYIAYQQSSSENLAFASSEWIEATPTDLQITGISTGVAWPDANNDGILDIFVSRSGQPNLLTLGTSWGNFTELTSPPLNSSGSNFGVAWADYDNDGDEDALITDFSNPVELVRNDGGGTYTNVTAGDLLTATDAVSIDWVDYDRDGDLDMYLCRFTQTNMLLENDGAGVFTDVTPPELALLNSLGATWADFDGDTWPDALIAVNGSDNRLIQNTGGGFLDVSSVEISGPGSTRGLAVADYDNDGLLDFYMVNTNHANELLHNDGSFSFSDDTQSPLDDVTGGYDADWADLDNDGDPDLYLSNNGGVNKLFRNDQGTFADITHGPLAIGGGSRGLGFGDSDGDGDLDLFVARSDSQSILIRNVASNAHHWLHLNLRGTVSNASAIGAKVWVYTNSGMQYQEVGVPSAYISQSSRIVEFGLGTRTSVNLIEVLWPSGILQTVTPSAVDTELQIVEPSPASEAAFRGMSFDEGSAKLQGLDFESQLHLELSDALVINAEVMAMTNGPSPDLAYMLVDYDGSYGLVTIDPTQGLVLANQPLEYPYLGPANFVQAGGLAYDPISGELFTVLRIFYQQSWTDHLGRVDPETGWVKNLPTLSINGGQLGSGGILALAFDTAGSMYAVSQFVIPGQLDIWELDRLTMSLNNPEATANLYDTCHDASFIGDEFWILSDDYEGYTNRIDLGGGGDFAPETGSADFLIGPMTGLASRPCIGTEGFLIAEDVPHDPGDQIDLDWSSFSIPAGTSLVQILRAQSACEILDPDHPVHDTIVPQTTGYRDGTADSYVSFHYGIRILGPLGEITEVLTAPAVFSFPNVLINEFAPAGGVQPKSGAIDKRIGEFMEIFNDTGSPLDLSGYRLSNGAGPPSPDEEFLPSDVVPTGGYYSHLLTVIELPDAGGTLLLLPPGSTSAAVDIVAYGTMGGAPTVPAGFTVSRVEGTTSATPDELSFEASTSTSGEANDVPTPDLGNSLVVNEVYYEGSLGNDYVELVNPLGSSLNLDRIVISDGVAFLDTLELGGVLAPGELRLFGLGGLPWVRDLTSEQLYLYKITSSNQLQRVDQLGWAGGPLPVEPEDALQRLPDGTAVYLGDSGTNWVESGGDLSLLYGVPSPGLPNTTVGQTVVVVDIGGGGDYTSIGAALAGEGPNTVILVMPGNYPENISLEDSTEIVGQVNGTNRPIILGDGSSNPAVIASGVNASAKLSSVTIRGVNGSSGPALLSLSASPTINQVIFEENQSADVGGAVQIEGGAPIFDGCSFVGNQAVISGGAVQVLSGSPLFSRCLFVLNEASGQGGAIFCENGSTTMDRCVVDRNGSWDNDSGVLHAGGGFLDINLSAVTFSLSGSGLGVSGGGQIQFSCGSLHGNSKDLESSPNLVTSDVVQGDPLYCEPQALGYALQDASPLANKSLNSCNEIIGITGPPCQQIGTDTPSVELVVSRLHPPYPNPFNPRTQLSFELASAGSVELGLYDQRGRKVAELVRGRTLPAGRHSVSWEGRDARGARVASGVYFARLKLNGKAVGDPQRLVLLK